MVCCCFGVISRFSQTKPLRDDSRVRASASSRSGSAAVKSSIASSLSMMRRGSPNRLGALDVGGEHLAVAVDDIGSRGRNRVLRCGAAGAVAVGADGEHHQASGQHGIDDGERQDRKPHPRARFRGAIDIAPVEQAADQPLPPRLRRPPWW